MNLFFIATTYPEELKKFERWMKKVKLKVPEDKLDDFKKDFGGIPGNIVDREFDIERAKKAGPLCQAGNHSQCDHYTNIGVNEVRLYHARLSNTAYEEFMGMLSGHISMGNFEKPGGILKRIRNFVLKFLPLKQVKESDIKRWQTKGPQTEQRLPHIDSLYIQPIGYIEDEKSAHGIDKV